MSALSNIEPLVRDELEIIARGDTVHLSGVISMRNPSELVTPYLRRIHGAIVASGLSEVTVDITLLRFMNSSSIRALVDWVEWVRQEPDERRYVLCFRSNPEYSWQLTTLAAIRALNEETVRVIPGG